MFEVPFFYLVPTRLFRVIKKSHPHDYLETFGANPHDSLDYRFFLGGAKTNKINDSVEGKKTFYAVFPYSKNEIAHSSSR